MRATDRWHWEELIVTASQYIHRGTPPHFPTQRSLEAVSGAGNKNVAAGEDLETEDAQFIQRECRTRVGEGHRGLEWLVNDLASPREYACLLEKQFPGQFVINSRHSLQS